MELQLYLEEKKSLVWEHINMLLQEQFERDKSELMKRYPENFERFMPLLIEHWQIVRDYPERKGKYIRPTLILIILEALTGNYSLGINTAAAMQISEDWILIHDDWEDGSLQRRGTDALHVKFGDEIAVNAGDTLHDIMHIILNQNFKILGIDKAQSIFNEFTKMLSRTTFGQFVELKWTLENKQEMTDEDIYFAIGGKTVYYSIAGPLRLGAIIANATEEQLERIYQFGYFLGISFQIKDDILDLTSNFDGLKEQNLNDIFEGKRTIMLCHLLKNASSDEKININRILDKKRKDKSKKEAEYIVRLMHKYNSIEYATNLCQTFHNEALKQLETLDFIPEGHSKNMLRELVKYLLIRTT